MNEHFDIYRAPEDEIPEADKARLDGYLAAKAEASEMESLTRKFEAELAAFKNA